MIDLAQHGQAVGQQCFVFGAMAEIGAHRSFHFAHPRFERSLEPVQIAHALRVVRLLRAPCAAQAFERGREFGDPIGGWPAFRVRHWPVVGTAAEGGVDRGIGGDDGGVGRSGGIHGPSLERVAAACLNAAMTDPNALIRHALIRPFLEHLPALGERAYIDPAAVVIGNVVLGDDVSIWPATVIRGDVNFIRIGARTNIQDGTVVHVSHDGPHAKLGGFATRIGDDVTIGHKAIIHACTIEDAALIGMGAIILDGAVVKKHAFVGAGALVPPGKTVGEGEMWLGSPARFARKLTEAEIEALYYSAQHYVRLKDQYLNSAG